MKKIQPILKPLLFIILGALMFTFYLNYLAAQEAALAAGIMGVVYATYYIGLGVVYIILGEKLPEILKKILDLVAFGLFPVFMFTMTLMGIIVGYEGILPTGWFLNITMLLVYLAAPVFYVLAVLLRNKLFNKLALLLGGVLLLVLVLGIVFEFDGQPTTLGRIDVIYAAINLVYGFIVYNALKEMPEPVEKPKEEKKEEPAKEEKPAEEAPKEEEPKEDAPAEEPQAE